MAIRVLIADDSQTFRTRLVRLLTGLPDIQVAGEAADGADALVEIARLRPDLLLLDLSMPRVDGFRVLGEAKRRFPGVKVIVVTSDASAIICHRCAALGADAVIDKADVTTQLARALEILSGAPGARMT